MKKLFLALLVVLVVFSLAACGRREKDTLTIFFVPSRDAQYILDTTEPLKELLKAELALLGFDFKDIIIEVGNSYEAVGEGMIAGSVDVGFLPGGTYALYSVDGEVDVILAATRNGLNKDFADAKDWNDGEPTLPITGQVTYYRSLIIAGPSAKGQALAAKVNSGEALTWADVSDAQWCIQGPTSSAGTVYPSVLLYQLYEKRVSDLGTNAVLGGGYGGSMSKLAAGICDVATIYADARRDYHEQWITDYERTESIWVETNVILVTDGIFNDTISVSNATVSDALKAALQTAFMNIVATPAGLEIFEVYNHAGYMIVTDADYESARIAQALAQGE